MNRLALGTAQFGMNYGIANNQGQVPLTDAAEILRLAQMTGIDTIDTASAYGSSESVLGHIGMDNWRVITKLPPLPTHVKDVYRWACDEVDASLKRLGIDCLHGLLLHRSELLLGSHAADIQRAMRELKAQGKVRKTGVSIYNPHELDLLETASDIELVQSPLSIFDRRLIESGWLDRLLLRGVEVHTRSVFLQGLLLIPAAQRPLKFQRWSRTWDAWDHWLNRLALTPLQACLRYPLSIPGVSRVVVGVDGAQHLSEILSAVDSSDLPDLPDWPEMPSVELLNPSLWQQL